MNNAIELLDIENSKSLLRKRFKGVVNLSDLNIPVLNVPANFIDNSFNPGTNLDLVKLSSMESDYLLMEGYSERFIRRTVPGICEAVKNAYEHGNKRDPNKQIILARSLSQEKVEYLVGDEGGVIDANLFPYILLIRKYRDKLNREYNSIPSFYDFREEIFAPVGFSGVGTKTMHLCFDNVGYYKNSLGGLTLHLEKINH